METIKNLFVGCALMGLIVVGCANEEGDEVECPVCDEATETLVGTQCVPYEEIVVVCGPDGHLHGSSCHCFGGQEVTHIDGVDYCLQEVCGVVSEKVEADEHAEEGDEHAEEGDEHAEEGDEHAEEGDEHAEEGAEG